MNRPLAEGDRVTCRVGRVLVVLTCIRPGAAYRAAVCYGSTGREVPELSRSHPTETEARTAAREHADRFADGRTVDQHLRLVTA